jgi:hypothetical protein
MSPDEFLESMKRNDESFFKMFFKLMGQSLSRSGSNLTEFDLLRAAMADDRELEMRRLFAEEIKNLEGGMAIFDGADGSTIINHRNAKAMEILERELKAGKRRVSIFYGAGHLPDMQQRLLADFNLKRGGQYWLEAWKLRR